MWNNLPCVYVKLKLNYVCQFTPFTLHVNTWWSWTKTPCVSPLLTLFQNKLISITMLQYYHRKYYLYTEYSSTALGPRGLRRNLRHLSQGCWNVWVNLTVLTTTRRRHLLTASEIWTLIFAQLPILRCLKCQEDASLEVIFITWFYCTHFITVEEFKHLTELSLRYLSAVEWWSLSGIFHIGSMSNITCACVGAGSR